MWLHGLAARDGARQVEFGRITSPLGGSLKNVYTTVGSGLDRPESVLALKDGRVYASDRKRGVVRVLAQPSQNPEPVVASSDFLPNGIALLADGTFLVANLGSEGGIWHLTAPDQIRPFQALAGQAPAGSVGFVFPDSEGRIWMALTTKKHPRECAYSKNVADGAIAMLNAQGHVQILATGLGFPNEVRVHPNGQWLYVTETFARRLTRFEISMSGGLSKKETVCQFGAGVWPDGFEFDALGNVWVTSVVSNRLICVHPDGTAETVISDCADNLVAGAEENFQADRFGLQDLAVGKTATLGNVSSIAFAGPDRQTVYLGNLSKTCLTQWRSPTQGIEPLHWSYGPTVLD